MKKFFLLSAVSLGALLAAGAASAGGPGMLIGATEDAVRQPTLVAAKAEMDLLTLAGFNAVRITQIWAPGETEPAAADLTELQNVEAAARLDGVTVMLGVTNFGSRTTPLTEDDRGQFAAYAAATARKRPYEADHGRFRLPSLRGQLEHRPDEGTASELDDDRARRLRQARYAARPGIRRHHAARIDAPHLRRRVRRRDADTGDKGGRVHGHRAVDGQTGHGAGTGSVLPRRGSTCLLQAQRAWSLLVPHGR